MSEYNFNKLPNETDFQHLKRVCVDKINKLHNKEWTDIKEELKFDQSSDSLRKYARAWSMDWDDIQLKDTTQEEVDVTAKYKSTNKLNSDGSTDSDKLLKMSEAQSKDKNYLLEAHGFDANEFELLSAQSSIWNGGNSDVTLYSSKIKVKAKVNTITNEMILEELKKDVKPVNLEMNEVNDGGLLEISLFDMHFGVSELSQYENTIKNIAKRITSKKWDTILFVIGQDCLHLNDFKGHTSNLTMIGRVNMEKAIKDAKEFYFTLLDLAGENASNVEVIYSNGNHDEMTGYMLVQMLEIKYPQYNFESSLKERKAFIWKDVFLGFSHGDKGNSRLHSAFLAEFGKQMAKAEILELHTGHYHAEKSKDNFGIVVRTLSTGVPSDQYHYDNGWIGANKRFQLFEYSESSLDAIYYV